MRFIQGLRDVERFLGAEAIKAIGMALEFSQVIEAGRGQAFGFGLNGLDAGHARLGARHDSFGLFGRRR